MTKEDIIVQMKLVDFPQGFYVVFGSVAAIPKERKAAAQQYRVRSGQRTFCDIN